MVKKVITKDKKMSNNAGSCKIARFAPFTETPSELAEFADEFFDVAVINYTDDGKEQLDGYLSASALEDDLPQAAAKQGIKLPEYHWVYVSSDDWLTENVIKFAPVEEGEFYVYGIHEKNVCAGDKIGIRVYAATAFGSEHQTTKCCLRGISEINKTAGVQHKILDVGTGSGILALACAKLWPDSQITAVDIDEESVAVAAQNAADNGIAAQINTALSNGYQAEVVQKNAPYDVILANILARPLIEMAPDMVKSLKTGGYAVISGFIDDQVDWVVGEHQKYGLRLKRLYEIDNWRAALLEKK